jgi:hypothetical protein
MLALKVHWPQWANGRYCFETLLPFDSVYADRCLNEEDEMIVILNLGSALTDLMIANSGHTNPWYHPWRGQD